MLRVSLFTGGKDSLYASLQAGGVDAYVMFLYDFPEPSPHQVNLGASVATGLLTRKPVLVKALRKGRELGEAAEFLRLLGVDEVVAGDVYVDEHLKYVERMVGEAGASLKEPLWGRDPEDLLHKEVEAGIEAHVTGVVRGLEDLLGWCLNPLSVERFKQALKGRGADPLGELGEYHTLVANSPAHRVRLRFEVVGRLITGRGAVLKVRALNIR